MTLWTVEKKRGCILGIRASAAGCRLEFSKERCKRLQLGYLEQMHAWLTEVIRLRYSDIFRKNVNEFEKIDIH